MDSCQSEAVLSGQLHGKLRPMRLNSQNMQPREGMGLQRLRQTSYFGEAPSSGGPLRRRAREWQETEEQRVSDTQVKNALHRVIHAQKNRQLDETKEELERIKCRVDATVEAYEESSRQVFDSYKSRASMKFLEDLDQLEGLLSNVLDRKRYEQQVTVFIVGFQETCDQQEQVLTQLHEFFSKNSRFPSDYEETVDRDVLDFDDSTEKVQEALLSAENATQRMLDLSKEMMSYLSFLDSKGTKKGRKRIEKALNQAKDDVNQLTEKLLAAYKGMEQNDENLKALLKQNEIKTLESQHFRTHAIATKRTLETCQQDWEVQRTLLQRQVATAAARAQETEEAHCQATAQVESLMRLVEEQAKQLEQAVGAFPHAGQVLTAKWHPEEPQVYESRDDAGKESPLALRAECEQPIPLPLPEEETPGGKSSEKSSPRGDSRLAAESPKSPLCDVSPSPPLGSPASTTRVAPRRGGTHGRPGEAAVSPRCGSEPSGSPTSLGAVGARSEEGSQSERSNPSPVAEERLPEEATRLADERKDWAMARVHELENEITGLMESKQREVKALKEELRCSNASWEKERHSLKKKVNQMVQLQKFAQKDFQRSAENSQTAVCSWNAWTHVESDAPMRENSSSAGTKYEQSSSPLAGETTAPFAQDCPSCMHGKTEALVPAVEPVYQEFLKVYSCTMNFKDNVVELLVNRGMSSAASGFQLVRHLAVGAAEDPFVRAQSMSSSIQTILNETTGVIISLLSEATIAMESLPQQRGKMFEDDTHDLTLGCEDPCFHRDCELQNAGSVQGSVNVTEDGLKITSSLEMISSFGSTQRVLRSTSVFSDRLEENSVKQFPVSNVKVVFPALEMEEPQSSEGFLQERVHFLEQELVGKQLEFDEERERNLNLVAELRKQIRALQRSALGDNACSPEDPTSAQILESIVFFTRTDMEHNVRKLRRGFYNKKVQRGHCEDAMSAMEKIVVAQRKRLVLMAERYVEHVSMKRIRDNVSRNFGDSRPVCDLLERMETMQSKRHRHWSKQMAELSASRMRAVEQLTRTLCDIEEESGLFLIRPYLFWISSVKSRNSKCKKVMHQPLVERRSNASNVFSTPPPSPAKSNAVSLQGHGGSSLHVQGSWLSQGLHSSSLKLGNACKRGHGSSLSSLASSRCTSSTIADPHFHKRSLQKAPCQQHLVSPRLSPDGAKIPTGCQDDEGRRLRIFINSGQTTACQAMQLSFVKEKRSQRTLPPLHVLADLEPNKDMAPC
ncbi:uncharacterized protein LOC116939467 isoform X3 [Petromyzon marinus]|uniref:uncharacterized protein LOC116939467 isoform X3 n=1 Tax=Petromyzon marinus TaxID=7757 RepID=UPI003F6FE4DC